MPNELDNLDTSNVKTMIYLFAYCYSLEYIDISTFNTQNVKYMQYMFYSNKMTELNLTSFNL